MQVRSDPFIAPPCEEDITILYRDDSFLLINKPSQLLSLSGKNPLNKDSVHYRLVQEFPSATLVHRLDFGTSGIMIVALNKQVNAHIGRQFQQRTVKKIYTALLLGHVQPDDGEIDLPIAKGEFPLQKICHDTGKPALTSYRVIERLEAPSISRVVFTPESGRTHQLRIHSQALQHPILGCDLYASDEAFVLAERLMLHANSIEFDHPLSGERIYAVSPCPF